MFAQSTFYEEKRVVLRNNMSLSPVLNGFDRPGDTRGIGLDLLAGAGVRRRGGQAPGNELFGHRIDIQQSLSFRLPFVRDGL